MPRGLATYLCTHSSQSLNSLVTLAFLVVSVKSPKFYYLFSAVLFAFAIACAQKPSRVAKIVLVPKKGIL